MKKIIKKVYNNNKILFLLEILSSLELIFLVFFHRIKINRFLFLTTGIIFLLIMIILIKRYRKKIEYLFLILIIPISLGHLLLMIPNYVPDEGAHIVRAYSVASLNLFPKKDKKGYAIIKVPRDYENHSMLQVNNYEKLQQMLKKKTNYKDEVRTMANNAAGYSFVLYIIPSIGMNLGRILGVNFYVSSLLARLCNLIFFVTVGFFVLKRIPFGKLLMFVYLLTPMFIEQAVSCSADSFVNTIIILFISYILELKYKETKEKISLKQTIFLSLLIILISCCKIVYFPICAMIFLLKDKIDKKDKKIISILMLTIVVSSVFAFLNYQLLNQYTVTNEHLIADKVNSKKQLSFVVKNPIFYTKTIIMTLINNQEFYIKTFMGELLGWLNIVGSYLATIILAILMVIAPFLEKAKNSLKTHEKIFTHLLTIILFNMVLGAMYLSWTRVGGLVIEGVQGRYFIPVLFLSGLALVKKNKYIEFKHTNIVYFFILFIINLNSLYTIFQFFQ